ncbi:MAG: hypothetical protein NTZ15_20670 [Burkholderiales bacterium]|nr:hypothetical protein [Burkholderiales bacterium]
MPAEAYAPFAPFDGELEAPGACLDTWQFEQLKQFRDHHRNAFRSLQNLIHQLHSLRRVTLRLEPWQPDVVMFLRSDMFYHAGFSQAAMASVADNAERCMLPQWHWWGGLNDRFALCGAQVFKAYGCRIKQALAFAQRTGRPLNGERLVHYALSRADASVRTTALEASCVRVNGQLKAEKFAAKATTGSLRWRLVLAKLKLLSSRFPGR